MNACSAKAKLHNGKAHRRFTFLVTLLGGIEKEVFE